MVSDYMVRRTIESRADPEDITILYASQSARDIGEEYGFSESTIRRYLRRLGIKKEDAVEYSRRIESEGLARIEGQPEFIITDEDKEVAKKQMIDMFYSWALTNKVRGGRKVIRKILDRLESINVKDISIEDDGTFQMGTGDYAIDREHKEEFVKLRINQGQRRLDVYMRGKIW
jgi:predicted ArsR family transcriptional regulator